MLTLIAGIVHIAQHIAAHRPQPLLHRSLVKRTAGSTARTPLGHSLLQVVLQLVVRRLVVLQLVVLLHLHRLT